MKNILKTAAIASVMTLVSTGVAMAETITFTMSGTVGNVCTSTKTQDGTLAPRDTQPNVIATENANGSDNGGAVGLIEINCNGSATITISEPVPVSADAQALEGATGAAVRREDDNSLLVSTYHTGESVTGTVVSDGVTQILKVNMYDTTASGDIPAGSYEYTVDLDVTPQ